ncbi:hypothetical protein BCR39DRAFT_349936 [Naematelia encephala]|uniref:Histidine kinase n=1 Tax=Naematelia encephala TaxID=71784 RepID=A0A1Y2AMK1_9TREE|nr:hypothetical protein BCR39DRAFT_349936 [Naematelia encephala]
MINHVDGLDLSGVPIAFLEAHPFPAFVLVVPIARRTRPRFISRDTDVTVRHYDDEPALAGPSVHGRPVTSSTVAWGNEKWLQVLQGRSMDDCLSLKTVNRLQAWIEGDEHGFGEYHQDNPVFVLELQQPAVVLHLAKTMVPLTPPSSTHSFCVITSQVQGSLPVTTPSETSASPEDHSASSTSLQNPRSTTTDTRTSISTDVGSSISDKVSPVAAGVGSYFPTTSNPGSGRSARTRSKGGKRAPYADKSSAKYMQTALEECWAMMDGFDWAATELGPREHWAEGVDPLLSVTFQSQTQDVIWLGDELRLLYNKPYSVLVNHPTDFGKPAREVWASVWDAIAPGISEAMAGHAVYRENQMFGFGKWGDGHTLESYHTWRFVPILDKDKVVGFFNQTMDTSENILAERRLSTVRDLSDQMLIARSTKEYFASIADAFEQNPKDAPFVMCYSIHEKPKDPDASYATVEAILESSVGVPFGHPSALDTMDIKVPIKSRANFGPKSDRLSSPTLSAISALSSGSGRIYHISEDNLEWPIAKALSTRQPVVVNDCRALVEGFPLRVWEKLPFSAIIVPICSESTLDIPQAVLVLGLNVRRPFDGEYDSWVHVIRSQLASSLVSVKASEEESKRQEEAAKMERAKAAWFRGAAHHLRSPLTLINGPVEDLLSSSLTPSQKYNAQLAKRNVDRLTRLVNCVMDFSRLEAGRITPRFVATDLGAFITELAQVFRPAVERMNIKYYVDVEPSDKLVYIDPTLVETIMSNLVGNAMKFTESGSITIRLTYGEYAEVSIIDTGVGIPSNELPHLIEWYHRDSADVNSATTGTGLGLALAKELLRLHDGELVYTSEYSGESENHGSTFTARIPLKSRLVTSVEASDVKFGAYGKAIANEALRWSRDEEGDESNESSEGTGSGQDTTTSKGSEGLMFEKSDRIMIVDDNADMREYIRRIFVPYCKVTEARDGLDAYNKAIADPPDLILTDVMTPRLNGLDLLERLRSHPKTKLIPTVISSAMQGDEAKVDALIMGAEDYISKPFKPKELLARVHLHMQVGKKRIKLEKLYAERQVQISVLSDYCPSGIMRADASGRITYANKAWRTMAGMADDGDPNSWPLYVDEETHRQLAAEWETFLGGTEREASMKWRWKQSGRHTSGLYIRLDMVAPGMSGIMGCLTDITYEEERVKEAELRRLEAEESKHQQELLIDLTSHEIRTPVSAILQCSSLVKENLVALKDQLRWSAQVGFKPTQELLDDLEEDVEALESECLFV